MQAAMWFQDEEVSNMGCLLRNTRAPVLKKHMLTCTGSGQLWRS